MNLETVKYYDDNASAFVDETANAPMGDLLAWFLSRVPEGGRVLDWGCGSGRDAKAMLEAGYVVDATDASHSLCAAAAGLTGLAVHCQDFAALDGAGIYDGIWASASLLHVTSAELPLVLAIAERALRPGGVLYCSFKYGDFEGVRAGRYFTYLDETGMTKAIGMVPALELLEMQITHDVRPGRGDELWLNCLALKR